MNGIVRTIALAMGVICTALDADPAAAAEAVEKAPQPDWVDMLELEEFRSDRSGEFSGGLAYLLSDRQVRKTDEGYEYFERYAYRVLDRSALEDAASISNDFDPENDQLFVNDVTIIRDDERLDRLEDTEITVIRQEEGLSSNLIDGHLTALIQLEDIRVGDVVDYAFTYVSKTPLWPDELFAVATVEWSVPLAQNRFRVVVPKDYPITSKGVSTDQEVSISQDGDWTIHEVVVFDADPVRSEQWIPGDLITHGYVDMSSMSAWSEVVDWALPLFDVEQTMPRDFKKKLNRIRSEFKSDEERALRVLQLVQQEIRYLGIEVGLGSHVPRSPQETIEQGFGDCKDKTVLLIAALDHLGIDAVPALASLTIGRALPQQTPSINSFNHAIAAIEIDGARYWVDPTGSHQGGTLTTLAPLDYGYVLPLEAGASELIELETPLPTRSHEEVFETIVLPESGDTGLEISARHVYRDWNADSMRAWVSGSGDEVIARSFVDYYNEVYAGMTMVGDIRVNDDLDSNTIEISLDLAMSRAAFDESRYVDRLPVAGRSLWEMLPTQLESERISPIRLPYGINVQHHVRVETPGRTLPVNTEQTTETAPGLVFSKSVRDLGEAVEMDFKLAVYGRSAALNSASEVTSLSKTLNEQTDLSLRLGMLRPSLAGRLGLDSDDDSKTLAAIRTAQKHKDDGERIEALTLVNRLLSEHEEANTLRGYLLVMKGELSRELDRDGAAASALRDGLKLYEPEDLSAYFSLINVLGAKSKRAECVEAIELMLERDPDSILRFNMDWLSDYTRHLYREDEVELLNTLYVALGDALRSMTKPVRYNLQWIAQRAIRVHVEQEEIEQASELVKFLQDPSGLKSLLTNRKYEALWSSVPTEEQALVEMAERWVDTTARLVEQSPDDFEALHRHIEALMTAKRYDDAIEFAKPIIADWARIEAVGDYAYWFVNAYAESLSEAGRKDEALDAMDRVVAIGVSNDSDLINQAINRASLLVRWGEFERALAATNDIENLGEDVANEYGWMLIHSAKSCSLRALGEPSKADEIIEESMLPLADKNRRALTITYLCANQIEKAADVIIDRLNDDDDRNGALLPFNANYALDDLPTYSKTLYARGEQARSLPRVQEAMNKVGRLVSHIQKVDLWMSH